MIEKCNAKKPAINPLYRIMQVIDEEVENYYRENSINPLYRIMQDAERMLASGLACLYQSLI